MNSTSSGIANTALASTETGGLSNLTNRFALDTQGFDALRAQANASPQQGLKAAAKQFDAVFTTMMLKSMRDATPSDSPFESNDTKSFTAMLDQQLSQQMSSKGIGVADAMYKQLMRTAGIKDTSATGGAANGMNAMNALSGGGGSSDANAGNIAAMNAMAKAYAAAQANKSGASLNSGNGYTGADALDPGVRGSSSGQGQRVRRTAGHARASRERGNGHSGALHHRPGGAGIGLGQARDQVRERRDEPQHFRHQGDVELDRQDSGFGNDGIRQRSAEEGRGALSRLRFLRSRAHRLRERHQEQSALRAGRGGIARCRGLRARHAEGRLRDRSPIREKVDLDHASDRLTKRFRIRPKGRRFVNGGTILPFALGAQYVDLEPCALFGLLRACANVLVLVGTARHIFFGAACLNFAGSLPLSLRRNCRFEGEPVRHVA